MNPLNRWVGFVVAEVVEWSPLHPPETVRAVKSRIRGERED